MSGDHHFKYSQTMTPRSAKGISGPLPMDRTCICDSHAHMPQQEKNNGAVSRIGARMKSRAEEAT